VTKEVNIMFLG